MSTESATPPLSSVVEGGEEPKVPFYKNPFVIAFVIGAAVLTVLPFLQMQFLKAPPPIASLGDWALIDQDGQPISDDSLKGQVWIASVFFSRCPSICPGQQASFGKILEHVSDLKDDDKKPIRLVSFTVDPEFDTPAVLKKYAEKRGGKASSLWTFATGEEQALKALLVERMFLEVGEKRPLPAAAAPAPEGTPEAGLFDIAHAAKFVLIDQNGDVRGYWDTDDLARGNLINAARLIWKRGPNP